MKRKTKQFMLLAITAALMAVSTSCLQVKRIKASDNFITKEVKTEGFNAIELQGGENLIFQQSSDSTTSIKVYGADNIVELMNIRVENGVLKVSKKDNVIIFGSKSEVKVTVIAPKLNSLVVQGSGDAILNTPLHSDKLNISIQGSGNVKGDSIICNELTSTIQGSGDIDLKRIVGEKVKAVIQGSGNILFTGEAKTATLESMGSGDINAAGLKVENVNASTLGSGDIVCHATSFLKGSILGSGDITYKGNPKVDFAQGKKEQK
ncbi:head GIN domain-containing protein [Bacteroides sedimenti]|uniref:DUF2807 domain-containing protein n=1 Tax=Bacteroides sedimenti TaxID=2136147 RepID=A0ABN6ZDK6_9BACE